jgi:preflagellin peptidase FlaK
MNSLISIISSISLSVAIILVLIAAAYDIKYNVIPNKLTSFFILFGIFTNVFYSIILNEIYPIFSSIILIIVIFVLSFLFWKLRIWGGGDVKLVTGISSLFPFHPIVFYNGFNYTVFGFNFPTLSLYPFPLTVIFNSILISFPFLIVFILLNYFNSYNIFKNIYKNVLKDCIKNNLNILNIYKNALKGFKKDILLNKLYIAKFKNFTKKILSSLLFSTIILFLTIIFILIFIKNKTISLDYVTNILLIGTLLSLFSSIFMKFIISNFRVIIKKGSKKDINILNLKEGMILDEIFIDFNKSQKIIENKTKNQESNLHFKKTNEKFIIKSKTAAGLSKEDMNFLKDLNNKKIIPSSIPIKIGIPFGPSIAISLIVSIFIGDLSVLAIKFINVIIY